MKKALNYLLIAVLFVLYCAFIAVKAAKQPMNSDSATMLLYAEDILSGNIFLSGWHLTGLTFLTTDLPFYIIGVLIAGVSLNAFRIAVVLMWIYMAAAATLTAVYGSKRKWLSFLIMAAAGLFPTTYALSNAFVHTAVFGHLFAAALFLKIYHRKKTTPPLAALGIITALAVCGDGIALVMITLPFVFLFIFKGIDKKTILSVLSGTVAGIFIERLYLFIGGADLNTLLQQSFIEADRLWQNISVYIEYFLRLINAYFFGKALFSVKTVFFAARIISALFAVFIIFRCIKAVFRKKDFPAASSLLGSGFVLMTAILFVSTINTNITAGRYIGFMPLLFGIILSEFADGFEFDGKKLTVLSAFCICLALTGILPSGSEFSPYNTYSELAGFLQQENLKNGYGSFWDASVINAYSENQVKVRPVLWEDGAVKPRIWFCKDEWYSEFPEFVLVRNSGSFDDENNYKFNGIYHMRLNAEAMYGITYDNAVSFFGQPASVKAFKNYSVLIYK